MNYGWIALAHFIVAALLAVVVFAAEPDPRLQEIQQKRQQIEARMQRAQMMINAVGMLEFGDAELARLNEQEQKIKAEKPKAKVE